MLRKWTKLVRTTQMVRKGSGWSECDQKVVRKRYGQKVDRIDQKMVRKSGQKVVKRWSARDIWSENGQTMVRNCSERCEKVIRKWSKRSQKSQNRKIAKIQTKMTLFEPFKKPVFKTWSKNEILY